jgi:hypothetical protein
VLERADDQEIRIRGIELRPDKLDVEPVVIEDWRFRLDESGDLRWEIQQQWMRDCELHKSATPGLFFNIRANAVPTGSGQRRLNPEQNGVATFLWVKPDRLERNFYSNGELIPPFFKSCELHNHVVYARRDGWCLVKLYTSFPHDRDLYLKAENGFLFRRGRYNSHSEIGLLNDVKEERFSNETEVSIWDNPRKITFRKHERANVALIIGSRKAADSGLQLRVDLPDKSMQVALENFYNGLANAGMWASPCEYETGNQPDGWKLGTFWMPAVAYSAGVTAPQALASDAYSVAEALKAECGRILNGVNDKGIIDYGFVGQRYHEGTLCPEGGLHFMLRLEAVLNVTGDIAFVREHADKITRLMEFFEPYLIDDLLVFERNEARIMVYFDGWKPTGIITYLNLLYVKALEIYGNLLESLQEPEKAGSTRNRRKAVVAAINQRLWADNAFGEGHGGYVDMIDSDGRRHCYFCSATEYPAIVFGVADKRQSKQILETADARMGELRRQHNCKNDATLDTLWPVESMGAAYPFGTYQHGAILACWTYFEIVARCQCGEVDKALALLERFSAHARETNWFEGDSAFDIRSKPHGWGHEPFLSDQVAVPAALLHGILGLRQTPDGIRVSGNLPSTWTRASADLCCFGKTYRVTRTREETRVEKIDYGERRQCL